MATYCPTHADIYLETSPVLETCYKCEIDTLNARIKELEDELTRWKSVPFNTPPIQAWS